MSSVPSISELAEQDDQSPDNNNYNDKVFYSTLIIHFISHITVI